MALAYGTDVKNIGKGVFFTNCINVCDELLNDKYMIVNRESFKKCDPLFWENVRRTLENHPPLIKAQKTPLPYQSDILKICERYYENNKYGRLYMPCGTGKSLMGLWIASDVLKCKKIFIAVPSLYLLSATFETWVENIQDVGDVKFILIGSDIEKREQCIEFEYNLTTKQDEIMNFIDRYTNNCTYVFITTYQSAEIMINACNDTNFTFDIGIYDEAHRTTGEKKKEFSKLLNESNLSRYRLFMTATERVYRDKLNITTNECDEVYSMDDTTTYGDVIYTYSMRQAITNGQLVDYNIVGLLINKEEVVEAIKNNTYVNNLQKMYDIKTIVTCYMVLKSISEVGMTHMLVFCNKNEKAGEMNTIMKDLIVSNLFNNCNIKCWALSGDSSMTKRKQVIKSFESSENGNKVLHEQRDPAESF